MDAKQLMRWATMVLAIVGLTELIVGAWAIEAKYSPGIVIRDLVGEGPKIAIAAGVFLMAIAVASFFAKFEDRMHLLVITGFLTVALVLSIAAMGVAIRDNEHYLRHLFEEVGKRLRAVAGISGFSAILNFLVIFNAAIVIKDAR